MILLAFSASSRAIFLIFLHLSLRHHESQRAQPNAKHSLINQNCILTRHATPLSRKVFMWSPTEAHAAPSGSGRRPRMVFGQGPFGVSVESIAPLPCVPRASGKFPWKALVASFLADHYDRSKQLSSHKRFQIHYCLQPQQAATKCAKCVCVCQNLSLRNLATPRNPPFVIRFNV